jgi:hypothetical protein
MSGIERQEFNPTVDILDKLAGPLNIDVAEFLALSPAGEPEPAPLRPGRRPAR